MEKRFIGMDGGYGYHTFYSDEGDKIVGIYNLLNILAQPHSETYRVMMLPFYPKEEPCDEVDDAIVETFIMNNKPTKERFNLLWKYGEENDFLV